MINNLSKKISLIILLAMSIPLLFIVGIYSFSYYNNVVKTNAQVIDKFFGGKVEEEPNQMNISNMQGIYSIDINDGSIVSTSDNVTDEIKEYAFKIADSNKESGIVGNYIYKKRAREVNDKNVSIILIESKSEITKIKVIFIVSIIFTILFIIIIYFLSKHIASIIVKPVEDTFSKQIEFISDASHELKTPLAVIQANADVLEGDIGDNKWLKYIQNETDNMGKLISELLLLTKIENIDKLRSPEKFNLSDQIELVTATFESMSYEKSVKIETNIEKNIITENFNKDDIEHILSTLIDNAIKHTYKNKKVIVELIKNKDNIEINVKNQGDEIPIEERKKIFERFYRIDKSRNRNEKRYGLGLSIAKSTVLKNHGSIFVDCKNGFTIFKVKLPI